MASCTIQKMEIPVRMVDRRPVATLVLNGTEVPMLVDSGAFFSLLSTTAAAQLNLPLRELPWDITIEGYTGKVAAKLTTVETVGLRDVSLKKVEFIVGGNQLGAGIMGVMGRNFLAIADTEYDLAQGVVRLVMPGKDCAKANLAYWAGDAPVVELPLLSGASRNDVPILLDVSINGAKQQALFDTGATGTSLSLKAARRAGIKASDMTPVNRVGGVGQGLVSSWTAPVDLLEVGGEKVRNSRLRVDDIDSENGLLVGLDYFLSHRIYVSRMQQRVYITWNGTPIFPPGGGAAGTYDSRYAALPQAVAADDADALARRGAAFLAAGQHARALDDLNRACDLKPTVAEYRTTRAQIHLKTKNTQAALADLDEALRLDPALAQARFDRAWLQHFLKNQAASLADLKLLDNQLPPSAHLRANMADLFTNQMQAQDALKQIALWLESHPQDARRAQMLNSRCWLRVRLNQDLPLALEDCKKSIRLDDEAANIHDSLGWVYLRMADLSRAKRAFDASIKLKPLAYSHYGRSLVHLRSGDKAQSDRDLAEARRLQPKIDLLVREEGFAALEGVSSLAASVDP
jgi:predicted aspartyl protease/tetratricopeptide (TPR) repeat protein